MGVDRSAETRRRKGSASAKQESERLWIRVAATEAHLRIEGQALVVLAMRRVGLNELVVEKDTGPGKEAEEGAGIWEAPDVEEFQNEGLGVVYAISERIGVDLLQLVHFVTSSLATRGINDLSLCLAL